MDLSRLERSDGQDPSPTGQICGDALVPDACPEVRDAAPVADWVALPSGQKGTGAGGTQTRASIAAFVRGWGSKADDQAIRIPCEGGQGRESAQAQNTQT